MKKRQVILSVAMLCLLLAVAWGFYQYNKPHTSAGGKSTDAVLPADSLYAAYQANETAAGKLYMNKILEVTGFVKDITMSDKTPVILLATGFNGDINCSMALDSNTVFTKAHKLSKIAVKGKCSGYLMDVNLVDCVIK
ncbi:MAG TPA: hypothetical protein VHB48_18970 [Chitinophagaceae bacterium]|jgi:hypothetical protein|nr:hypothetical protein [Chitinophagaceae bacterium]